MIFSLYSFSDAVVVVAHIVDSRDFSFDTFQVEQCLLHLKYLMASYAQNYRMKIFSIKMATRFHKEIQSGQLCKKYRWKMRPQSLHLHMYKNCKEQCRSKILEHQGIRVRKIKKKKVSKDEEYHVYPISNPRHKKPLKFTISFNEEEWMKMKPVLSKRKQKLQPGWTDMVYDKIWLVEKLKCAYNFKTLSITSAY